jgi:hypothetical protein
LLNRLLPALAIAVARGLPEPAEFTTGWGAAYDVTIAPEQISIFYVDATGPMVRITQTSTTLTAKWSTTGWRREPV